MINFSNIMHDSISDEHYMSIVSDIINHPKVQSMKEYNQHGTVSRFEHCLNVSYIGYKIADKFGWDKVSIARAGLLHDFFFYDWKDYKQKSSSFSDLHAVAHGRFALENAKMYFRLNKKEQEMIKKHMWPVTIIPPRYMMTHLIGLVDKYCAIREVIEVKFNLDNNNICTDP